MASVKWNARATLEDIFCYIVLDVAPLPNTDLTTFKKLGNYYGEWTWVGRYYG